MKNMRKIILLTIIVLLMISAFFTSASASTVFTNYDNWTTTSGIIVYAGILNGDKIFSWYTTSAYNNPFGKSISFIDFTYTSNEESFGGSCPFYLTDQNDNILSKMPYDGMFQFIPPPGTTGIKIYNISTNYGVNVKFSKAMIFFDIDKITQTDIKQAIKDEIASNATIDEIKKDVSDSKNMLNGTANGGKSLSAAYDMSKEASDRTWDTSTGKSAATLAKEANTTLNSGYSTNNGNSLYAIYSKLSSSSGPSASDIANAVAETQRIKDIDTNTWNTYNYVKSKSIRVINGADFTEIVYTKDTAGSTVAGQTNDGLIKATDVGDGYTKLKGTLAGQGEKKVEIYNGASLVRSFMFNIIPAPSFATTATVNFME